MANELQLNVDALSTLLAQDPRLQPVVWNEMVRLSSETEDVFSRLTGKPGSGMPFIEDRSLVNKAGSEVVISTKAPLNGPGVMGNAERPGKEEQRRATTFSVKIDYWFNAVATDKQTTNNTIIFSKFDTETRQDLASWFGRKQMNDMKMKLILSADPGRNPAAPGTNILRPNYKGNREALRSADTLSMDVYETAPVLATTCGAKAANLIKNKGAGKIDNKLRRYMFFGTSTSLRSLKADSRYSNLLLEAAERDQSVNPAFIGGYPTIGGNTTFEHEIVNQETGPVGSPENPLASLGVAIASGTAAVQVYGGGSAYGAADLSMLYFCYWSNYPFAFTSFDAPIADATVRYAVGYNMTGANTGKFFAFSYVVNNGNQLTMVNRLGASATGAQVTTLGNMTYAASPGGGNPWAGLTCDSLAVGSPIYETNSFGVPIGYSYEFGEGAAIRAYGRDWMNRVEEKRNYGFVHGIGLESEYGQNPAKRPDGTLPNYVLIEHAIAPAGIPFPTVV